MMATKSHILLLLVLVIFVERCSCQRRSRTPDSYSRRDGYRSRRSTTKALILTSSEKSATIITRSTTTKSFASSTSTVKSAMSSLASVNTPVSYFTADNVSSFITSRASSNVRSAISTTAVSTAISSVGVSPIENVRREAVLSLASTLLSPNSTVRSSGSLIVSQLLRYEEFVQNLATASTRSHQFVTDQWQLYVEEALYDQTITASSRKANVQIPPSPKRLMNKTYVTAISFIDISPELVRMMARSNAAGASWNASRIARFISVGTPHVGASVHSAGDANRVSQSVSMTFKTDSSSLLRDQIEKELIGSTIQRIYYDCVYLDTETKAYSTHGCVTTTLNDSVKCFCNHTTIFAALLAVRYVKLPFGVKICSSVTESLSVLCLLATFVILVKLRRKIRGDRTFIQINLSFSLLILHLLNLLHDFAKQNQVLCQVFAILVHFVLISSAFWMLLEGVTLAIKTTDWSLSHCSHGSKVKTLQLIVGWAIPLAIVVVAVSVGYWLDIYMGKKKILSGAPVSVYQRCWLHMNMILYAVVIPVSVVLAVNVLILIKVASFVHLKSSEMKNFKPTTNRRRQSMMDFESVNMALKAVVTLMPILGLPWIISFLVGIESYAASVVLLYVNAILNGLQGVLLFFLYCINSREVRSLLIRKSCLRSNGEVNHTTNGMNTTKVT